MEGTSIRKRHRYVTLLVNDDTGEVLAMVAHRDTQRRPEGSKPAFDPEVFRSRFSLMRRPDKLDAAERARLDKLFAAHPRLKAAWDALGELQQLYLAKDREGALDALDRFADIYGSGQIPEFSDIVDTFLAWHAQILDWHQTGRPSNGRIEGTILWSVSEGVVDVVDGHMAGCRGRVLWSVSLESAMLLAA